MKTISTTLEVEAWTKDLPLKDARVLKIRTIAKRKTRNWRIIKRNKKSVVSGGDYCWFPYHFISKIKRHANIKSNFPYFLLIGWRTRPPRSNVIKEIFTLYTRLLCGFWASWWAWVWNRLALFSKTTYQHDIEVDWDQVLMTIAFANFC